MDNSKGQSGSKQKYINVGLIFNIIFQLFPVWGLFLLSGIIRNFEIRFIDIGFNAYTGSIVTCLVAMLQGEELGTINIDNSIFCIDVPILYLAIISFTFLLLVFVSLAFCVYGKGSTFSYDEIFVHITVIFAILVQIYLIWIDFSD